MGRFFQTAPTQFIEDYIYQPPWELIQQAAAQKQQIYDAAIASTKIFDNLQIDHLQGEDDVYNVKEKQRYYAESAANIAKAIQNDPARAKQYMSNIEALQNELQKDMTSGDLSHIIGSAQAYKKWQEDNKKRKEDDASRYTAAERAYLGEYLNAGGNSLSQGFRGEQVTKGIDYDAIRKSLGELKANKIKSTRQTPGGGLYMVETENGLEEMSEERMNGWMLSQILSPENLASLSQSEKFGLGTYRDSEGNIDYDNGSLFAPLRGFARAGHYSQQENSFKMSADSAAIAQMNEAGQNRRWAIDRQDRLVKEEKDRIDAANKTKDDKINAYDIKIAEAQIAGDTKAEDLWTNAKNNLLGREGTYKSNAGSMFKDFKDLQIKSANGNIDAQKQLSQGLNTFLRKSGIDFKDPKQKALAEDIVGKIKQNKLSIDGIEDYLAKRIPVQINRTVDANTQKFLKNRSVIAASNEKKQNLDLIKTKINQIEQNKALGNNVAAKARIQKLQSEIHNLEIRNYKINPDLIYKESIEDFKKNYRGYEDSNENFRNTFGKRIKGVLEDFSKDWEKNKSKFTTNYATAPLSISAQSSMKTILRDVNNRKDFVNEDGTEVSATQFNSFDNITSIVPTDGRGRYGLIATDKNGKQTRLLTNPGTPIYNTVYNIAKGDVNPNTEVGLAVIYPTVGIIKQRAEALKTAGQSNVKLTIKSAKGNTYYLHQVGNTDKFNVYDSFGNLQTKKGPIDYTQAGVGIDKNDNR